MQDNIRKSKILKKEMDKDTLGGTALTEQVVKQADGVFLWVRLAVRKILETFQSETPLTVIRTFVQDLPTDLEELFDKLLFQSQSKAQLTEASHIFQLVRAREVAVDFIKDESSNSLSVWEFTFALHAEDDDIAINGPIKEVEDDEIMSRCIATRHHIIARSAGLLEVYAKRGRSNEFRARFDGNENPRTVARKLAANRVAYLHRTVRDYLMLSPNVWNRLREQSSIGFDPHFRLLRSYILRLKFSLEYIEHHRRLDEWFPDIALSLTHARFIDKGHTSSPTALINELDKTISWYWHPRAGDPHDHWARSCFGTYEERKGNKLVFPRPFLALCTKFGLERYVLDMLNRIAIEGPIQEDADDDSDYDNSLPPRPLEETPLLHYALEFLTSRQKTIYPLSSPSFASVLLQSPHLQQDALSRLIGTPNMAYTSPLTKRKDVTPWTLVLQHLRDAKRRGWIKPFDVEKEGTERWTGIVRSLAQEGAADLEVVLEYNGWDPEASARDVITGEEILGGTADWWVHELRDIFQG
jgi:hypothetical protein